MFYKKSIIKNFEDFEFCEIFKNTFSRWLLWILTGCLWGKMLGIIDNEKVGLII